ncbi:DUF3837 domain-containing protein [Eisenbergiella tayi]|uniref:DUF3837 domain-containing protein n=1 Tax=Eisenbergiella tayi TaxID=1432052 RepID=UPI00138E0DDE|nr:DUF3837 domain-containing protein [Eisenbergiella tayi]
MVPSLARMSVIIKSQHETSVMTGNYEMAYICGLLCRLTGTVPPSLETPVQLQEDMMKLLENYSPEDDREKVVIKMLKFYKPTACWMIRSGSCTGWDWKRKLHGKDKITGD